MKFLVLTDTHLGYKDHNKMWSDLVKDLFKEVIDFCNENDIKTVIHMGDWFNSRKSINVLSLWQSIEICQLFERNGINLFLIKGNHDQFYKNQLKPHSLLHLGLISYVNIIDEYPEIFVDGIYLVPWGASIEAIPDDSVLFGHFEIQGFLNNDNETVENSSYKQSDFSRFKKVYSGHFHTRSKIGNIHYLGSAFSMDMNDVGDKRGYYVIDIDDIENPTFYEFTKGPKFIKIRSEEEWNPEDLKGNIVEYIFTKDYGTTENEKIIKSLHDSNPLKLSVNYKISVEEEELTIENEALDNNKIFQEYIDKISIEPHIKKDVLKGFIKKLEEEED